MPAPKLTPAQVTAKCVEVEKCFISTEAGYQEVDLESTLLVGDLARTAANIRQAGTLEKERLAAIAVALKIPFRVMTTTVLPELARLGWGETHTENNKVSRFSERIPPSADVLSSLGKLWEERNPTPVDRATVNALAYLSGRPIVKSALPSEIGDPETAVERALRYGKDVRYFDEFRSRQLDTDVAWTPLYWSSREAEVRQFLSKQSEAGFDELRKLAGNVRDYPGRPLEALTTDQKAPGLLNGGIATGFLPSVGIRDRDQKSYSYVFAPSATFGSDKSADIFERARMMVACIRHGQYRGQHSKIRRPRQLLRSLVNGTIGSHSYADVEYALLVVHRICDLELDESRGGKRYRPRFIDTPENRQAAAAAEQLLGGEEVTSATVAEPEVQRLLTSGIYSYSAEERIIRSKQRIIARGEFERMIENLQAGPAR